jgi:hypothetical protein
VIPLVDLQAEKLHGKNAVQSFELLYQDGGLSICLHSALDGTDDVQIRNKTCNYLNPNA